MANDNSTNNDGVFIYTGGGRDVVPPDVVRVRVHPSVTIIPEFTFKNYEKLEEVELCEGLLEIGNAAFFKCTILKRINIPYSVTRIGGYVFFGCYKLEEVELCDGLLVIGERSFQSCRSLKQITIPSTVVRIDVQAFTRVPVLTQLPDRIEIIGPAAFAGNKTITNFRIPPRISTVGGGTFDQCKCIFSIELPKNITQIKDRAFFACKFLRNLCLTTSAEIVVAEYNHGYDSTDGAFHTCTDLLQLFNDSFEQLINALKHRFDNLPIHKLIYYQSYTNVTSDELNNATDIDISQQSSKFNPTGGQQDSLGMTPLHIMACSTVQDISLYRVLVDKHPETLVTEDSWGALPLLYAVWGRAPDEVVQYLVDSYTSLHPDYALNWKNMVLTLGNAGAPLRIIQNLLDLREGSFPNQLIDWEGDKVLENLGGKHVLSITFTYLVKCSIKIRVNAIGLKHYRDIIMEKTNSILVDPYGSAWVSENQRLEMQTDVQKMLGQHEVEYQNLKEATSVLELVLWKNSISEANSSDDRRGLRKEEGVDKPHRSQCRISCGADIVIQHVLPYLLPN